MGVRLGQGRVLNGIVKILVVSKRIAVSTVGTRSANDIVRGGSSQLKAVIAILEKGIPVERSSIDDTTIAILGSEANVVVVAEHAVFNVYVGDVRAVCIQLNTIPCVPFDNAILDRDIAHTVRSLRFNIDTIPRSCSSGIAELRVIHGDRIASGDAQCLPPVAGGNHITENIVGRRSTVFAADADAISSAVGDKCSSDRNASYSQE